MVSVEHVRVGLRTPTATREQRGSDENATALRWPALVACAQINSFALQLLSYYTTEGNERKHHDNPSQRSYFPIVPHSLVQID